MITRYLKHLQHAIAVRWGSYSFPTHMQRVAADAGASLLAIEEELASFSITLYGKPFVLHVQHEGNQIVLMAHGSVRFPRGRIPQLLRNAVEVFSRKLSRCNLVVFDGRDHSWFVIQSTTSLATFDVNRFLSAVRLLLPYLVSLERVIEHFSFAKR